MTTTIKITQLSDIGANLTGSTILPVVNMTGTPVTQKTSVSNMANVILSGAGTDYAEAGVAGTVSGNIQPNITSVGTLIGLTVSNSLATVNLINTSNVSLGAAGRVHITGGANGQVLTTNGLGNLVWANATGIANTGNITFNDDVIASTNDIVNIVGNNYAQLESANTYIWVEDGEADIEVNGNRWVFNDSGYMQIPNEGSFGALNSSILAFSSQNNKPIFIEVVDTGNSEARQWIFDNAGTTTFPTLEVDLHNGGVQTGQVLKFGDPAQQAIITGPTPPTGQSAQRLIIQGQNGGTGEGGDVYVWGGDADTNGGDIKIYAGDADNASAGSGGYINLAGGDGFDYGGDITLDGGSSANGYGGQISITGGTGQIDGGPASISGGYAAAGNGGAVNITGGTSSVGPSSYGNVEIGSGIYGWTFDNSGNFTLPGNTFAVNYANGAQVSIGGGSANTSNVTFDNQVVIGTGDQYGGSGLYLAPGTESTGNLQYLRVRGGDYPTHIHLDTGNNQYFDQYFGADSRFVKLEANGNVVINADDYAGNGASWTFDINGNLNVPGGILGAGNLKLSPDSTNAASYLDIFLTSGPDLHLVASNGANLILGEDDGPNVMTSWNGNAYIQSWNQDTGNVGGVWTFDGTGNLALPGDIVGPASANLTIYANAGVHEFIFADDGTFYAPDNVVLGGNSIYIGPGANTLTGIEHEVFIASSNHFAYVQAVINNVSDNGSAEWVALGAKGDDSGGWGEVGFTSSGFGDANYTITGAGDGYVFAQAYAPGSLAPAVGGGNLVLSTGNQGTTKDIIFGTGGFLTSNIFGRISHANNSLELSRTGATITFPDATEQNTAWTGSVTRIANGNSNVSIPTSNDNVYITTNSGSSKQWIFDTAGNLRTPGNIDIYGAINFPQQVSNINWSTYNIELSQYGRINTNVDFFANANVIGAQYLKGDGSNISNISISTIANGTSNVRIPTSNGNVVITANGTANWTLDTTGNLTLPGNLVMAGNTNVFGTDAALIQSTDDKPLIALSSGANGAIATSWVEDIGNIGTSNIAAVYANPIPGSKIIRIAVGENGGPGPNLWDFNANGTTTFPGDLIGNGASPAPSINNFNSISSLTLSASGNITGGNIIGNGNTLSNVAIKTSGSWTLASGVNTVSINVPLNGTYSIWVNGNIPNGIITYTATAVITNTNVPVLGSQYAWYYAVGNALVFTSIPDQFVGTVGSISNVNTYAGNTANVFTFGITNNSGNTAVVNYGYTKL